MEGVVSNKKRTPILFRVFVKLVLVAMSPVWVPIAFLVFCRIVFIAQSIREAVEEEASLEWLTWQQVKCLAGVRPSIAARFAICVLCDKRYFFISRRRELAVTEKIARRLGMDVPNTGYPRASREVIFYEFRAKYSDAEKRSSWADLFKTSLLQVLQPARA